MSGLGTTTIAKLRAALADADIDDLDKADPERTLDIDLVEVLQGHPCRYCREEDEPPPQLDQDALDDFMSATLHGDRRIADALAQRLFTYRNLDIVEQHLARH